MRAAHVSGVLAALLLFGAPAYPAEWGLNGSFAQSFSFNQNPGVEVESEGLAYGTTSNIGLSLTARTRRTEWLLSTGVAVSAFGGEGATDDLEESSPRLSGNVAYRGQRFSVNGNFSFSRASTSLFTLDPISLDPVDADDDGQIDFLVPGDDPILRERAATLTALSFGASLSYELTRRTRVIIGAQQSLARYSQDRGTLTDNDSQFASLRLSHDLDSRTGLGFSVGFRQFSADNAENTEAVTFSATGSVDRQIAPSTTVSAGLGLSYSDNDELVLRGGMRVPDSENRLSVNGNLRATFRRTDETAVTVFADHGVRPAGSGGDIRNVTSFGGSMSQALTRLSSFSMVARHSIETDLFGDGDEGLVQAFVFSPSLSYRLTQNWSASLGYSFRLVSDDDGTGIGNRVFLTFSRGIALYP